MSRSTPSDTASLSADPAACPVSPPAKLGLLSRTVFASPEVHSTFPLRIRDWHKQDVALIGDSFVHIKEVQPSGSFRHVASKTDFPSRIRAAQVIGSTNGNAPLDPDPAQGDQQHAHVLLLTLESHHVLFITMYKDARGADAFATAAWPLAVHASPSLDPGRHLAADPYSRAFAVGAASQVVEVFEMKRRAHWAPCARDAVSRRMLLHTGMKIAKMDFLYRPDARPSSIFLLVVGYPPPSMHKPQLKAQLYEWSHLTSETPSQVLQGMPRELIQDHSVPQMLIPLRKFPGGFVLGCERHISTYFNTLSGHIKLGSSQKAEEIHPDALLGRDCQPGCTSAAPLWKAWARPPRNDNYLDLNDEERTVNTETLYIAREDGIVCFLDVGSDTTPRFCTAGNLGGRVESAFNHDGRSKGAPDGLIFGGSLSDGGAFTAGFGPASGNDTRSRSEAMSFLPTETLYNWAPFLDIVSDARPSDLVPVPEARLLSTSGKMPHGCVSQLRFGCEAVVGHILSLDQESKAELGIVTRILPFNTSDGKIAAFLSSPGHTYMLRGAGGLDSEPSCRSLCPEETLAASRISPLGGLEGADSVIRAGESSIELLRIRYDDDRQELDLTTVAHAESPNTTVAAIESEKKVVLVATRKNVSLLRCDLQEKEFIALGHSQHLDSDPVCATFFTLGGDVYALLADASGVFHLFLTAPTFGLRRVRGPAHHPEDVCSSLAVLRIPAGRYDRQQVRLICGYRSGAIRVIRFRASQGNHELETSESAPTPIGHSQVDLCCPSSDGDTVILFCDDQAMRIQFPFAEADRPTIHRIHFMNHGDRSFSPGRISALNCVFDPTAGRDRVICADAGHVYDSGLDHLPKPLPLRVPFEDQQPNRILYSTDFDAYFVASIFPCVQGARRFLISTVCEFSPASTSFHRPRALYVCDPGSTITSLAKWSYSRSSRRESGEPVTRTTRHLVVNTVDRDEQGREAGSIRFLKLTRGEDGFSVVEKARYFEESRINDMCQYDNETLLYCCGDKIKQRKFNPETGHDRRTTVATLEPDNAGQHITSRDSFVYVSTKRGSFKTYCFDASCERLELVAGDDRSRPGLAHLIVPVPSHLCGTGHAISMFTDKHGSVLGHFRPERSVRRHILPPVFQARLPVSMTRLIQANVRPPWKQHTPNDQVQRIVSKHALVRDVFGTATNGSFWSFNVLSKEAWQVLRFVQNLCLRNEDICPGLDGGARGFRGHVMPGEKEPEPSAYHIDGDVLARLVDGADAASVLRRMLDAEPGADMENQDFNTAVERRERFEHLLRRLTDRGPGADVEMSPPAVGSLSLDDGEDKDGGDDETHDDAIDLTIELIRSLVEIPF